MKPHLSLANLSLHSPSSIVGTPFDVEPRFEYPFPPSSGGTDGDSISRHGSMHLSPTFSPVTFAPSSLPLSRGGSAHRLSEAPGARPTRAPLALRRRSATPWSCLSPPIHARGLIAQRLRGATPCRAPLSLSRGHSMARRRAARLKKATTQAQPSEAVHSRTAAADNITVSPPRRLGF